MPPPSSPASSSSSFGVDPHPLSSAVTRLQLLARVEAVLPQLFALKRGDQQVKTVAFFVSQYWNDEADDAVHAELRYAFDVVTDPAALTRPDPHGERGEHDDDDDADDAAMVFDEDFIELVPVFNSNGEMIHAFASYACESSQDDLEYAPYCVWIQRPDGTFSSTVIGTMLRPEWEDRLTAAAAEPSKIFNQRPLILAGVGLLAYVVYLLLQR